MALSEDRQKEKKPNLLFLSLLFFSLPILVSTIFLIYVYRLKYDINVDIPKLINFNNNEINIKKLVSFNYKEINIIQYLRLYDFLLCVIFVFAIPYFLFLIPILFGKTGPHIKSYMIIAHMEFAEILRLIAGILLFSGEFYFLGIYLLYYLMDFETNIIRSGYLEIFLYYRIVICILSLAFIFFGFVGLYKYILLKIRLNSKKHA